MCCHNDGPQSSQYVTRGNYELQTTIFEDISARSISKEYVFTSFRIVKILLILFQIWKRLFGEQEKRELLLTLSSFPLPVDYEINDVITKLSGQIMGEENFEMVA